uniref:MIP06616p n=1 Tax=Drosophila melanogaster TaxID=7227 RepID=C0PV93_DROME|nr:MIP06616p [Drosophila melanogaster]
MSDCGARPKKPMSAFMLWINSTGRKHIKAEHPDFSVQEVSVKGGEMWRAMADEDKIVWQESATTAMAEYKEKLKQWNFPKEHRFSDTQCICSSNTNQCPTLFVYDTMDDSMTPICRKCLSKTRCLH